MVLYPNKLPESERVCFGICIYDTPQDSFMDYARLIRHAYTPAADVSNNPQAFARSISYSRYISEVNGDNREAYRILLIKLCRQIEKIKD